MAKLARAVIIPDPNRRRDLVFRPGEEPAPEYAVLITSPSCWEGGKLPTAVKRHLAEKKAAEGQQPSPGMETTLGRSDPTDAGQDTSGGDSQDSGTGDQEAAPAARKTAARNTAATKPARGRTAADKGTSGE